MADNAQQQQLQAQAQAQAHPLALPEGFSPDSLDVLTELATILSRLRPPQSSSSSSDTKPAGTGGQPSVTGTTPLPAPSGATGELSLKDVPSATDALRVKLQRARQQIRQLPDMGRTVAQQREEMAELEDRMRRQRDVLSNLRDVGVRFSREEAAAAAAREESAAAKATTTAAEEQQQHKMET